ncbi:hypothetical protein [Brevibacillus laterosporus]|uniref:Uncharacterized protein n=1 Tax=Brevibacillus laterosporus TaxID=1465 RepID=A0AAP3DLE1_BRELA|nr:hypothetical protein [Brevibacillus laterosporus]MCR8983097.1 hypothetical protein [Brevibacillus laterosporus]MCR8997931.1 hypothetical protein [Brevibacillus laterosporus]MCZ0810253.1 hypothetical protein [Brevibacillus laterosporus]MCZ0828892.1 hypothetical protein [Brevibacillus laterosporus]MCZ0852947.1 hypothetical protein [Brevibacillus laterosporus]
MTVTGSREWYRQVGERFGVHMYLYASHPGRIVVSVIGAEEPRRQAIEYIKANAPIGNSLVFRIG